MRNAILLSVRDLILLEFIVQQYFAPHNECTNQISQIKVLNDRLETT